MSAKRKMKRANLIPSRRSTTNSYYDACYEASYKWMMQRADMCDNAKSQDTQKS